MNHKRPNERLNGDGSPPDEAQVRDLIVGAGERPSLPEEDLQAIRAAAKTEWQGLVSRRTTRSSYRSGHVWALAASLVVVIGAAWLWISTNNRLDPRSSVVVATVERVDGVAQEGLVAGSEITLGSTVETRDQPDGTPQRLALRLSGGASFRIDSHSNLIFSGEHEVELLEGGVYMDTGSETGASDPMTIITELGVVRHVGTQYEVRLVDYDNAVRVRVREGTVSFRSESGTFPIAAGEQFELADEGAPKRDSIPTHGPDWDWVSAVAPSIEIDDLPIRAYLEWLSRETGRSLIFENEEVERYASEHSLTLPIEGLSPMESLEAARLGSDLIFEAQNGSILVLAPNSGV